MNRQRAYYLFFISIHEAAKASTFVSFRCSASMKFQSTKPQRLRHREGYGTGEPEEFQSTKPQRLRHNYCLSLIAYSQFQSTKPQRLRQLVYPNVQKHRTFQSTKPQRLRRADSNRIPAILTYFNPRSRKGFDTDCVR